MWSNAQVQRIKWQHICQSLIEGTDEFFLGFTTMKEDAIMEVPKLLEEGMCGKISKLLLLRCDI